MNIAIECSKFLYISFSSDSYIRRQHLLLLSIFILLFYTHFRIFMYKNIIFISLILSHTILHLDIS